MADCVLYGRVTIAFTTAFMLQNVFQSFLIAAEKPKLGLLATIAAGLTNILLDALFVGSFGWGVAGASAATAISKLVSWCILMTPYFRKKTLLTIRFRQFRPRWSDAKEVCAMGSASFFRNGLGTLAGILLNRIAVGYGTSALAAINVANRITMFMTSACLGFGQGFQPVCGFNYGAGLYHRVKEGFWFSVKVTFVLLLAVSAAGFAWAPQLVSIFRDDPEVIAIGTAALRFQCVTFCLQSWVVMGNMCQQTMGLTVPATFMAVARQGLFFIPTVWILALTLGLPGIQMAQMVADLLTFLCSVPIQIWVLKKLSQPQK